MIIDAICFVIMASLGITCAVKENALNSLSELTFVNKGAFAAAAVSFFICSI
jgi:hypothetical protein